MKGILCIGFLKRARQKQEITREQAAKDLEVCFYFLMLQFNLIHIYYMWLHSYDDTLCPSYNGCHFNHLKQFQID